MKYRIILPSLWTHMSIQAGELLNMFPFWYTCYQKVSPSICIACMGNNNVHAIRQSCSINLPAQLNSGNCWYIPIFILYTFHLPFLTNVLVIHLKKNNAKYLDHEYMNVRSHTMIIHDKFRYFFFLIISKVLHDSHHNRRRIFLWHFDFHIINLLITKATKKKYSSAQKKISSGSLYGTRRFFKWFSFLNDD